MNEGLRGATTEKAILYRLRLEKELDHIRRKIHSLRLATAGDFSMWEADKAPQHDPIDASSDNARAGKPRQELYNIMTREFGIGLSNELARIVRTMVLKSSFRTPSIEFEDIEPLEAAFASAYLSKVFEQTNAAECMRFALLDMLIGGYGFVWASMQDGNHWITHIDSLDVIWDPAVDFFPNASWMAAKVNMRLKDVVAMWGEAGVQDLIEKDFTDVGDMVVPVIFYYDTEDDIGTYAAVRADKVESGEDDGFLEGPGPNPHYVESDGYSRAIMPILPIHSIILPSTRFAMSVVEQMMPHQIQSRMAESRIMDAVVRGGAIMEVDASKLNGSEETIAQFLDGEPVTILPVKAGGGAINRVDAVPIPDGWRMVKQDANMQITAMGGDNPYSSGKAVTGIKFAAESVQIGQEADLMASDIAQNAARHGAKLAELVLANAVYHESPVTLRLEGMSVEFDADTPVWQHLVPDARAVVSEDSMRYLNKGERVAMKERLLNIAIQAAQIAPAGPKLALEQVLREMGIKNVSEWFELPMGPEAGASGMPMADEVSADMQ